MSRPQLAPGVRRPSPELLVGRQRVLRLSAAGAEALDALLDGSAHPRAAALHRRLLDAGMLLLPPGPARIGDVTVVVPARAPDQDVQRVLDGVPPGVPVVVVDDSGDPPRGPAATRNLGAAQVRTGLVAFVDTGVQLLPGALERLSGHFADERVVAVAPRVVSDPGAGAVGVLESVLCALDQGAEPAEVRPGAAVSYVPSAVLLVRRDALERVGGFDEALHVGEDVDLVWRLSERGVVRYDPEVVVRHAPRTSLRAALRRRCDYGSSAGPLDLRHPGRLRHLRVSWWSLLPWGAAALVHPVAGPVAAGVLVAAAPRRLRSLPPAEARRVAAAGQWSSFGAVGRYAVRPALPMTVATLLISRRARRLAPLLVAAYVAGSGARLHGPARELPLRATMHVADDVSYSCGVWRSAVRFRRWRVLLPGRGS